MSTQTAAAPRGFSYFSEFLNEEEQVALLQHVESLDFTHDVFCGQPMKRSEKCFGFQYRAIGRRLLPAEPFDEHCAALVQKALPYCPDGSQFDQCIIQNYPAGAGIGWHTDAPVFDDVIIGVSLGAAGRLQFRPNGSKQVSFEILAAPGSLYVMRGPARCEFQHQVPPVKAARYSLTFRQVTERCGVR